MVTDSAHKNCLVRESGSIVGLVHVGVAGVTPALRRPFQLPVRLGVATIAVLLALTGCGSAGTAVKTSPTPSDLASPTPSPSPSPSPSSSPSPPASPAAIPSWAAMRATCSGASSAREAVLAMQGSATVKVLADVTDPVHPHTLCTLTGGGQPRLVTMKVYGPLIIGIRYLSSGSR